MRLNLRPLPPENGLMYPPPQNNRQELYECVNCTFVTTHLNFLLAHNTVCISDHEKIDLKKCPHCPHVTNRQYALNKHINTMHTKAIWYSCDLCNYRSTDSSCLRRHKRNVHPEVTGNELCCHLCAYRCMTEYHLKKHLLKHDENTILQCQFCSYSTKDRSNFRKHIFIHNPKAQDCEFCDYKCVSPYQMKVHLKKYHHGVGMEDIDCRSEVSISEVVDDITAAINETQTYIGHQAE
ncbi:hypothetical protein NQ314_011035 [Rhamnusium bicolor]|uniref:C2H2-type domain-containing protein n=1 Tax=Rhamnusium bicolor TaxID=1586634 RepID=A0AAV8XMT8_9CUCU|nr:hypothetical protein NQ314_011035 [Rhamnusium bicolor]